MLKIKNMPTVSGDAIREEFNEVFQNFPFYPKFTNAQRKE